ncbi:MAG: glycosyltransferase [Lachnospiraceae bacterium]|jgi:glycosyltransferase involved in cell wall biosynthesis|nr:glycosyltransferase [Lachnospiraceae bacterium]
MGENGTGKQDGGGEICPVRVLHVLGRLELGGAESRIMDLYRRIDRRKVQFDFLVHTVPAEGTADVSSDSLMKQRPEEHFDREVLELGGRIYALPRFNGRNGRLYRRAAEAFFAEHHDFAAVQGHITSVAAVYLPIAKKYGVKVTIAHVRSAGTDPGIRGIATKLMRLPLRREGTADRYFACSREAALSVYGRKLTDAGKVRIIPNAIDPGAFAYSAEGRARVRASLGLGNAFVIGHVGSFRYAKNHAYLLQVFAAFRKNAGDARLLLVGDGELLAQTELLAQSLGVSDSVIFAGRCSDPSDYYSAMDAFCFPSRYEGLPGSVVEAQASGLPCFLSDAVTRDVDVTELVTRLSLQLPPEKWAAAIAQDREAAAAGARDRGQASGAARAALSAAGFDAASQAQEMQRFYLEGHF